MMVIIHNFIMIFHSKKYKAYHMTVLFLLLRSLPWALFCSCSAWHPRAGRGVAATADRPVLCREREGRSTRRQRSVVDGKSGSG